jgi:hypothetical protein
MRHLTVIFVGIFVVVSAGCAGVEVTPGSKDVEIVSQQRLGSGWGEDCERLGTVRATVGPLVSPSADEGLSKTEVEVRNKAYEMGATHAAVGSQVTYNCNSFGMRCGDCSGQCFERTATAYKCESEQNSGDEM